FEPDSVVTYLPPPPFAWSDLPFYLLRWSEAWNRASLAHFARKWALGEDEPFLRSHYAYLTGHRQEAFRRWRPALRRTLGCRREAAVERAVDVALPSRAIPQIRRREPA